MANSFLLLNDGTSKVLLDDGTSKVLLDTSDGQGIDYPPLSEPVVFKKKPEMIGY